MKNFNLFDKLFEQCRTLRRVGMVLVMCLTVCGNAWGTVTYSPLLAEGFEGTMSISTSAGTAVNTNATANASARTGSKVCYTTPDKISETPRYCYWTTHNVTRNYYIHAIVWVKGDNVQSSNVQHQIGPYGTSPGTAYVNTTTSYTRCTITPYKAGGSEKAIRLYYKSYNSNKTISHFWFDDLIMYTSSENVATDLTKPSSATGASGTTSRISWSCGSDTGDGATGIQNTQIWKRTSGSSDNLTLNDQGIYAASATDQSRDWTCVSATVGATATYYDGTFAEGRYAIVHRDLAYNYSTPTYVTVTAASSCTTNATVTAGSNSSVTATTATVTCSSGISSLGSTGCSISSYGFVIGTSANPAVGGSGVTKHQVGTSYTTTGTSFYKDLTGLTPGTTYYVRPYATNGNGTAYGTQTSFTTDAAAPAAITRRMFLNLGGLWGTDASYKIHAWGDGSSVDYPMTRIGETGIYYADIPISKNMIQYVRNNYDNQSYDLNWHEAGENQCAKITAWHGGDGNAANPSSTSWEIYHDGRQTFALGNYVYYDNSVTQWSNVYFRIGKWNVSQAYEMTKEPGTKDLYSYQRTGTAWEGYEVFNFADNWANQNGNVYYPDNDKDTWSGNETNFARESLSSNRYYRGESPYVTSSYAHYHNLTELSAYTVTATGTNCTVTLEKCTDYSAGTYTALTSGGTVLPTQYIKVTVTPDEHYEFGSVVVTGVGTVTANTAGTPGVYYVTGNATVTATCTAIMHTITGAVNTAGYGSVSPASISVMDGSAISMSSNVLTCNGKTLTATPTESTTQYTYAFSNWSGVTNGATVSGNLTATANFTRTPKSYTLTWVTDGDALTGTYTSGSVAYGTPITQPGTPTKTGYTFAGWSSDVASTMPATNTTYTATWTAKEYDIVYKDQGNVTVTGEAMPETPSSHTYGTATSLKKRSKAGYVFGGWYTNSTCTEGPVTSIGATQVTASVTLYAKWTAMDLTALENNTLYTVQDMVPNGIEVTSTTQYWPGVSTNNIFNLLGTGSGTSGSQGTSMGSSTCTKKTIDGTDFTKALYFKTTSSLDGSSMPTTRTIQFKISGEGLLDIYCYKPTKIYLIKSGGSAVQLDASDTDEAKITKAVSAGTYYLYGTEDGTENKLYGLKFTPNYTITYNTDGADESQQTNGSKTHGVNFTLSSTRYTKDGYWQTGWATERGGSQVYAFGATYTDNADLTLYPAWAVKAEYEPDLSTSAKLTAAVISDDRWMLTTGANVVSDPSTVGGDAATNLTGDKYGLAFAPGDGSKATFDLGANTTIYKLTVQMVSGCKEAWPTIQFENEDYDDNLDKDPEWDEESAWTLKTFTYTYDEGVSGWRYLNFYGYDGCYLGLHSIKIEYAPTKTYIQLDNQSATSAGTTGVTATYGASTNLTSSITAPSKTGYIFGGYYTEEDGEGTQLIDEDGAWLSSQTGYTDGSKNWQYPDADLTLYAKWTEDECGITLTQFGTQYKTNSPRRTYAYTSNSFDERFIIETDDGNCKGVTYSSTDSLYLFLNNTKKFSVNASDVVKENDSIFTDVTKIKFKYRAGKSGKSITLTFDVYVGGTKVGTVSKAITDQTWYTETINVSPAKDGRVTFKNTGSSSDYALHFDAINICGTLPDPCTEITPTWSTDYTSTTLNVGATSSTPVVGKDGSSGTLSFSSSDDAIATVNSSGVVTAVKSGSVTITATVAEDEENNKCEGTVTKTFTIKAGITYNTNGADSGDAPTDATYYAANADITILGNTGSMIKDGKVFNGWNTKANGSGTHYEVGATMKMPNKSAGVTLYAEWVGYATSWEWWNSGEGNGSTTFTYLTNKNYVLSFTTNGDNKATWDISGGQYYRGVKLKTKDDNMSFWVQTGKRVSITFGTRPTKPTFTVGGVDKSSDVGASTNSDSVTVTYTTSADTKFYIENETSTGTAFTIKRVKIEDACTSITPSLNHSSKTLYAFGGTPRQVALVVSGNTGSGDVTWTSSDDGVATVTSDGLVTAVAPGTATITATIEATGDYCAGEAECTITVPALVTQTINVGNSDAAASWGTPPNMSFNDPTSTLTQNAVIDVSAGYTFNKEATYKGNRGGRYMTAQIKAANGVMSDSKYLSLSFNSPSHDVRVGEVIVPIQPVTDKLVAKASISDGTTTVWSAQSDSLAAGSITDAKFTFSPTVLKAGTITVKVYVYGQPTDKGFRLANTIYVNGAMLVDQRFTDANSTGIWSDPANWDGGSLPEIYHDVVIEKPVAVDIAHATAKSIVIYNDGSDKTGKLTIQPNKGLEVDGTIQKTTDGSTKTATGEADLVLESSSAGNASLIFNNSNSCQATVQMYSKASIVGNKWNWQYVGTPFTGSIPLYNYYGSWMYKWDNGGWAVVKGGDELDPFAGYCLTQSEATTHVMGGTLVPTTSKSVTMAASTDMVLANSWTAPISIASFDIEGGDATFTSTPATIYLFNTGSAEDGSSEGTEAGTYIAVPINSAPYTGNGLIAPMQGFFVTTNGGSAGSITMNYNDLVRPSGEHTDIVAGPMKAPKRIEERPEVMKIRAEGSVYNDRVVILSREDFSQGFDNGWDGKKMSFGNASPSVYVINEEGGYDAVSAIPEYEGTVVGFRAGTDSEYTIRFEYDGEEMLYLNDLQEQEATPIDSMRTYTFTAEAGDNEARFIISATPVQKVTTGVDPASGGQDAKVRKVIINDHIYIIRGGRMYSVDGALVK